MRSFLNYLFGKTDSNKNKTSQNYNKKLGAFSQLIKHLPKIIKIIFPKFLSVATLILSALLINVFSLEYLVYRVGLITGSFTKSLTSRDSSLFISLTWKGLILIVLNAFLVSTKDYVTQLLGIIARKCLTLRIHDLYFNDRNFYFLKHAKLTNLFNSRVDQSKSKLKRSSKVENCAEFDLNSALQSTSILIESNANQPQTQQPQQPQQSNVSELSENSLDNPDQRITQDVNSLCNSFTTILPTILVSPFLIGWYTYQSYVNAGYLGPVSVYVYFIIWCLVNGPLTIPIARVIYLQDRKEGDFRFSHMNIRVNAESIAFYDSSRNELSNINKTFESLLDVAYRRNWVEFCLKFFVNTSKYLGGILSYMVLAIPIFGHVYDDKDAGQIAELISNFSFKSQYLLYLLTRLFDLFDDISNIAGNTYRVGELIERMNANNSMQNQDRNIETQNTENVTVNTENKLISTNKINNDELLNENEVCFILRDLSVYLPNRSKTLIKDLNFKLEKERNVLLTGQTGCGKTSLLRCINGLWKSYTGQILLTNKNPNFLFFLPQCSYFTNGSLLEQIIYPSLQTDFDQFDSDTQEAKLNEIKSFLKMLNLENLLVSVDNDLNSTPTFNWTSILSNGEQQRLSFLRVLYHRPKFVILDEFTSSVDQDSEALMYESLNQIRTTYLSVAHRDTVRKFHQIELKIFNDSTYQIINLI